MASLVIGNTSSLYSSFSFTNNFQHVKLFPQRRTSNTSSWNINNAHKHLSTPRAVASGLTTMEGNTYAVVRRSGNYPPTIWDNQYLQSLSSVYSEEIYKKRAEKMKEEVMLMIQETDDPSDQLKLIDDLERLGLWYHFEDEIYNILKSTFNKLSDEFLDEDLFTTSLKFRLLRQHGFRAPQEIFNKYKDQDGKFKLDIASDTEGLLSLYEASYLSLEGETSLDEAKDFARKHLVENLHLKQKQKQKLNADECLSLMITHSLKIPLHWRMPRQETRWFIDVYATKHDMDPLLLEFAKLDFNILQAVHQNELKVASRWWDNTGFGKELSFARDRVVENFMWSMGEIFQPEYGYCRVTSTKINSLITVIDDVYDIYGTLEELEIFTKAIERWDINAIDKLPTYMKHAFLALFNTVNEMAFVILKEQDLHVVSSLKKAWVDLTKCYIKEARWYHTGYTPTFDEYLETARISIGPPMMSIFLYYLIVNPITQEARKALDNEASVVRNSAILVRFYDDFETSSDEIERGDVPKSLQCYMNETGAPEEEARVFLKKLIDDVWKKLNEDIVAENCLLPRKHIESVVNLARLSQWMYEHGDAHGVGQLQNKERILALLVNPIPM